MIMKVQIEIKFLARFVTAFIESKTSFILSQRRKKQSKKILKICEIVALCNNILFV